MPLPHPTLGSIRRAKKSISLSTCSLVPPIAPHDGRERQYRPPAPTAWPARARSGHSPLLTSTSLLRNSSRDMPVWLCGMKLGKQKTRALQNVIPILSDINRPDHSPGAGPRRSGERQDSPVASSPAGRSQRPLPPAGCVVRPLPRPEACPVEQRQHYLHPLTGTAICGQPGIITVPSHRRASTISPPPRVTLGEAHNKSVL